VRSGLRSCVIRSGLFGHHPVCCGFVCVFVLLCCGFLSHFLLLNGMRAQLSYVFKKKNGRRNEHIFGLVCYLNMLNAVCYIPVNTNLLSLLFPQVAFSLLC
jgi:hypothetical protein